MPGEPATLAVLLDSPAWAERRTTSDRDALPVTVLERIMGWPAVARVWLPAWLADREAVVREVAEATRRAQALPRRVGERVVATSPAASPQDGDGGVTGVAVAGGGVQDALPASYSGPAVGPDPIGLDAVRADVEEEFVPFVSDVVGRRGVLDGLPGARSTAAVQAVMRDVVDAEGPVSGPRLARLVGRAYGLSRVLDDRVARLSLAIPTDLRRDAEEGFVWPEHRDPLRWTGYRRTTGPLKDRPLDEVALREIANAMTHLAGHAMGITEDELAKETFRVFGGSRLTPAARERLGRALAVAVRERRLAVVGGIVVPAPR